MHLAHNQRRRIRPFIFFFEIKSIHRLAGMRSKVWDTRTGTLTESETTENRFKFSFCSVLHPFVRIDVDTSVWLNRFSFTRSLSVIIYSVRIHLLIIREWDINTNVLNCLPCCDAMYSDRCSFILFFFVSHFLRWSRTSHNFTAWAATEHLILVLNIYIFRPTQCALRSTITVVYILTIFWMVCVFSFQLNTKSSSTLSTDLELGPFSVSLFAFVIVQANKFNILDAFTFLGIYLYFARITNAPRHT